MICMQHGKAVLRGGFGIAACAARCLGGIAEGEIPAAEVDPPVLAGILFWFQVSVSPFLSRLDDVARERHVICKGCGNGRKLHASVQLSGK